MLFSREVFRKLTDFSEYAENVLGYLFSAGLEGSGVILFRNRMRLVLMR